MKLYLIDHKTLVLAKDYESVKRVYPKNPIARVSFETIEDDTEVKPVQIKPRSNFPIKKPSPGSIPKETHSAILLEIFKNHVEYEDGSISRGIFIPLLKTSYYVGGNKIEQKGGYLHHLIKIGLLMNVNGFFYRT